MMDIVPDYMTALVGYRAWNVTPEGDLVSITSDTGTFWPGKEAKRAICTLIRRGWAPGMVLSSTRVPPVWSGAFEEVFRRRQQERARRNHHAPMPDCACGIYAMKSATSDQYLMYMRAVPVCGEVYLWGRIQEYSQGYRAEFAYPKSLRTTDAKLAPKIAERYGVPCEVVAVKCLDGVDNPARQTGPSTMSWSHTVGGVPVTATVIGRAVGLYKAIFGR